MRLAKVAFVAFCLGVVSVFSLAPSGAKAQNVAALQDDLFALSMIRAIDQECPTIVANETTALPVFNNVIDGLEAAGLTEQYLYNYDRSPEFEAQFIEFMLSHPTILESATDVTEFLCRAGEAEMQRGSDIGRMLQYGS